MKRTTLGLLVSAIGLAGCAGAQDQPWTTKQQSVLGSAATPIELSLQAPARDVREVAPENLREVSIDLLLQAASSSDPLLRANAIEALHPAPEELEPVVRQGLADPNRGVRFAAAVTAGRFRLASLAYEVRPLLDDPSASVRAAAIYALRRCDEAVDPGPLVGMLFGADAEVRGNAAYILGELGNPSALMMLRKAIGRELSPSNPIRARIVDLQIAEAMVKLGEAGEMEGIRAALYAPVEQGELIALACQMCGRLRDSTSAADLSNLIRREGPQQRPAELRLTAVQALALIDASQAPYDVPAAHVAHERAEVRAQAAAALGAIGDAAALPTLQAMLADSNPLVQMAAARAVLQIMGA